MCFSTSLSDAPMYIEFNHYIYISCILQIQRNLLKKLVSKNVHEFQIKNIHVFIQILDVRNVFFNMPPRLKRLVLSQFLPFFMRLSSMPVSVCFVLPIQQQQLGANF